MVMTLQLGRIGKSTKNLLEIVEKLKEKDINLSNTNQRIDASTPNGAIFFTMASAFATYERDLTEKVLGRKSNLNGLTKSKIIEMKTQRIGLKKIAAETKISVKTIRNFLKDVA